MHGCCVATLRCERLWQHHQQSEHITPTSSDVPWTVYMFIQTSLQSLYDSVLRHHTSLWEWMTQHMDHHLELEYITSPVLNATHCPEEDQCNLVETLAQDCCYFVVSLFCWLNRTHVIYLCPAENVITKLFDFILQIHCLKFLSRIITSSLYFTDSFVISLHLLCMLFAFYPCQ